MSELTPLQKLEEAIEEFLTEVAEEDGDESNAVLSAWTLSWQLSRVVSDDHLVPLQFTSDYTFGVGTSPEAALGLASLTASRITRDVVEGGDDDE
jgi:hypothetical protein